MPWADISAASRAGSRASSRVAITTRAPLASGRNSSSPAISKPSVVTASRRSWPSIGTTGVIARRKLAKAAREICTPLGVPVEPEV
ncbi:hypothetical protein D3C81_1827750 [compost metagenome]